MKCEFGWCPVCDKEIASKCGSCQVRKPNEFYTEVLMNLSNGSKMVMAVCIDCASKNRVHSVDKADLMLAVKAGWIKNHQNSPKEVLDRHMKDVENLSFVE